MKVLTTLLLTVALTLFLLPGRVSAQGVVDLPGFGSVYYGQQVINPPNAERYASLIAHMWGYVHEICVAHVDEASMEWCSPGFPEEINIHVIPFSEFMDVWMEGMEKGLVPYDEDKITCIVERKGCILYGFTITDGAEVFDIYFFEEPVDVYLIHEIVHVMEVVRGESFEEDRTQSRQWEYYASPQYVEWLMRVG